MFGFITEVFNLVNKEENKHTIRSILHTSGLYDFIIEADEEHIKITIPKRYKYYWKYLRDPITKHYVVNSKADENENLVVEIRASLDDKVDVDSGTLKLMSRMREEMRADERYDEIRKKLEKYCPIEKFRYIEGRLLEAEALACALWLSHGTEPLAEELRVAIDLIRDLEWEYARMKQELEKVKQSEDII